MQRCLRTALYYREYAYLSLFLLPLVAYFILLGPILGALPKKDMPTASLAILPFCDRILLLGFDLRAWLASHTVAALDLIAGFVYLYHFVSPVVNCIYFKLTSQSVLMYAFTLGVLNLSTVFFQISFPTAPPWFVQEHPGVTYWHGWNVTGSAAGLTRVDDLLGFDLFGKLYGSSTLVFGSFPSLHAAWPFLAFSLDTASTRWLHLSHYFYVSWAAMYLNHHYLVDVLGGGFFAAAVGVVLAYFIGPKMAQLWEAARRKEVNRRESGEDVTHEDEDSLIIESVV